MNSVKLLILTYLEGDTAGLFVGVGLLVHVCLL